MTGVKVGFRRIRAVVLQDNSCRMKEKGSPHTRICEFEARMVVTEYREDLVRTMPIRSLCSPLYRIWFRLRNPCHTSTWDV